MSSGFIFTLHTMPGKLFVLPRALWGPSAFPPTGVLGVEWLTEQVLLVLCPPQSMLFIVISQYCY